MADDVVEILETVEAIKKKVPAEFQDQLKGKEPHEILLEAENMNAWEQLQIKRPEGLDAYFEILEKTGQIEAEPETDTHEKVEVEPTISALQTEAPISVPAAQPAIPQPQHVDISSFLAQLQGFTALFKALNSFKSSLADELLEKPTMPGNEDDTNQTLAFIMKLLEKNPELLAKKPKSENGNNGGGFVPW